MLNIRERDLVDIAWITRTLRDCEGARQGNRAPSSIEALQHNFWADTSQQVNREPWSEGVSTLCAQSVLYSFEYD